MLQNSTLKRLSSLHLKNLVLVEECHLKIEPGFTVITGETGAGKTALLEAIKLILGHKADLTLIRQGSDKAIVEAEMGEHLIRRELMREGKNRAFINDELVTLPELQEFALSWIELIDQHAHHGLKKTEMQRHLLDLFGGLSGEVLAFQALFEEEKAAEKELETLFAQATEREKEWALSAFEELDAAQIKEGEEEALFAEYRKLASVQEIGEKVQSLLLELEEAPLPRWKHTCEALLRLDPALQSVFSCLAEAALSLNEASESLGSYFENLEADPSRFAALEQRLSTLAKLKRKYGADLGEALRQAEEKHLALSQADQRIEELQEKRIVLRNKCRDQAKKLSELRKKAALIFQNKLTKALRGLNMPDAELNITLSEQARTATGEDRIDFWLKANKGEQSILVKESSSGGELARLLLAIKIALAENNQTPILIFDEIDANVGGETAALLGEKLKELGASIQVLCVTHFAQVAHRADQHIRVRKEEKQGRTHACIETLTSSQIEQELLRMVGGSVLNQLE